MRDIKYIIIHWEGSPRLTCEKMASQAYVDSIRRFHIYEKDYNDIGYHYLVDCKGNLYKGRNESISGAHTLGYNYHSIGICMLYSVNDRSVTKESLNTLVSKITDLCKKYNIKPSTYNIFGHSDVFPTMCPGIVHELLPDIVERVKNKFDKNIEAENDYPDHYPPSGNDQIKSLKIVGPDKKEYKGLLVNSQGFIYIPDVSKMFNLKYEYNNNDKSIRFSKGE